MVTCIVALGVGACVLGVEVWARALVTCVVGVDFTITVGVISHRDNEVVTSSQCTHDTTLSQRSTKGPMMRIQRAPFV